MKWAGLFCHAYRWCPTLIAVCLMTGGASLPPAVEFDSPYQLRVMSNGTVLEVVGSISWAVPQNFEAALAAAPRIRVVRLDSPGGHIQPALQMAAIINQRRLDTFVDGFCASACTIAFLGGRHRQVGPDARFGFHRAHGPGLTPELADDYLRAAYEHWGVPTSFISHVLRVAPTDLWFPTPDELRAAGLTTGAPSAALENLERRWAVKFQEAARLSRMASDDSVVGFAIALWNLLEQLQNLNPEVCWTFVHLGTPDVTKLLPTDVLDAFEAAYRHMANEVRPRQAPAMTTEARKSAMANLIESMRNQGRVVELNGLRAGSDRPAFCVALRSLIRTALTLPKEKQVAALRSLLSNE